MLLVAEMHDVCANLPHSFSSDPLSLRHRPRMDSAIDLDARSFGDGLASIPPSSVRRGNIRESGLPATDHREPACHSG